MNRLRLRITSTRTKKIRREAALIRQCHIYRTTNEHQWTRMTEKKQFSNNSCLLVSIRGSSFVTFVVKFGFCEQQDIVKLNFLLVMAKIFYIIVEASRNNLVSWFSNFDSWQGATNAHSLSSVIEGRRSQGAKGQSKWVSYFLPAP